MLQNWTKYMNNGYIMLNEFTIWPSRFDQSIWPDWKAAVGYCKYKENHVVVLFLKKKTTTTDLWTGFKKRKKMHLES